MCGICGWIDREGLDEEILWKMTRSMSHRGPNAQKLEIVKNTGFGHARLSIIDLSNNANQPMWNEDGSLLLTYNGEFYNFMEYRDDLVRRGHMLQSNSDTDVLLHMFEEEGVECFQKMRGMFALGIWDREKEELTLARDRVGIKPLYYYRDDQRFLFGSEMKAILQHPAVKRDIDKRALSYYLTLGYIPRGLTIFKNVMKLLPGHYLKYGHYGIRIEKYWGLPDHLDAHMAGMSEEDILDQLYSLIDNAVKMRLVSDVPLGIFLSGGVDSSLVAYFAAKNSGKPINTFTIGFDEEKYDETRYARMVASHLGARHHEFTVGIDQVKVVNELAEYFDEPFADSSAIPTYYVSKTARSVVTVALAGDGGDELFGGYNWYDWVLKKMEFEMIPSPLRRTIAAASKLPQWNFHGKHFLGVLGMSEYDSFLERVCIFSVEEIRKLLHIDLPSVSGMEEFYIGAGQTTLERMSRTDFAYYLPEDILTKVDRASMAVSLEARVPLLDHKLCEYAFSLPEQFKIQNGMKKYLLKKLARRVLPPELPLERKQGFSIPVSEWMRGELGDRVIDSMKGGKLGGVIDQKDIESLVRDHKRASADHGKKLWALMMLGLWGEKYLQ
jgi:asparagine synthase (glutamine-hydrolysing)